jgi:intracellular sulfur oxidation DsrE/DsrF family protein
MRRILPLLAALATLVALSFIVSVPHAAAAKKHHILLQWTEADTVGQWAMTKHVGNLLDDFGQDNVQLEVIAYGAATFAVSTSRPQTLQAKAIEDLTKRGVVFHVCHHAMDLLGVKESELQPTVTPVKGAMWYITSKYDEGWQILRP